MDYTGLFSPNTYFHNFISDMLRGLLDCTTPPRITELGILDFILGQWEIRTCNMTSSMNGDFHLKSVLWFFLSIFLLPQNNEVELPPSPTSVNRANPAPSPSPPKNFPTAKALSLFPAGTLHTKEGKHSHVFSLPLHNLSVNRRCSSHGQAHAVL
jgi:hypothetical protein